MNQKQFDEIEKLVRGGQSFGKTEDGFFWKAVRQDKTRINIICDPYRCHRVRQIVIPKAGVNCWRCDPWSHSTNAALVAEKYPDAELIPPNVYWP